MGTADAKRCLGCGYILEGLPEPRCPECGRAFDPHDPVTYAAHRISGLPYLAAAAGAGLLFPAGLGLGWIWSRIDDWGGRNGEHAQRTS